VSIFKPDLRSIYGPETTKFGEFDKANAACAFIYHGRVLKLTVVLGENLTPPAGKKLTTLRSLTNK